MQTLMKLVASSKAFCRFHVRDIDPFLTGSFNVSAAASDREALGMQPFSAMTDAQRAAISGSGDRLWLAERLNTALPILPPATDVAQSKVYSWFRSFNSAPNVAALEHFCKAWNQCADGVDTFYLTTEILRSYWIRWERLKNQAASEAAIEPEMTAMQLANEDSEHPSTTYPDAIDPQSAFQPPAAATTRSAPVAHLSIPLRLPASNSASPSTSAPATSVGPLPGAARVLPALKSVYQGGSVGPFYLPSILG